nr:alpha/beta hydrolase [Micromonospora sp. DSM 115978]
MVSAALHAIRNLSRRLAGWYRRRRRWVTGGAALVGTFAVLVAFGLRDPSPVGYFVSAGAQDRFLAAYEEAMAELPVPDRTLDVRTSYGVVRLYRFAGANPQAAPLLLLPGRASASPVWADNLPALLRIRSVYTVDLLGEPGLSIQQRPIRTPADHAQWLHEVLLDLPEPRIHLFGLSIGGWTAMNLAVHRPEKVAGVLLLDPVLVFADLSLEVIVRSIPASVPWFPESWRDSFASWTANGAPVQDVPVARMIEAGMQSYRLKLSAPTRPTERQLADLRPPTLVLLAGESRMHDPVAAERFARETLPDATVTVYPDASHAINGEYPDRIAADVAAFLADQANTS